MQQYSILNEKMLFLCLCISPGSAEALCIWGKKTKVRSTAYFISNNRARNCQNRFMYVRL